MDTMQNIAQPALSPELHTMMLQLHLWPLWLLAGLIVLNIVVIALQKDDRKLKKYLRIQAIAWITLLSMVIFSGAAIMATLRIWFDLKIDMMILTALALSFLELRRHLVLKNAKPDQVCFAKARRKMLQYYIFELLWILMIVVMVPRL